MEFQIPKNGHKEVQANKQDIGPCLIYFLRRDFFDPFTGGNIVHFGNLGGGDIDRKISVY